MSFINNLNENYDNLTSVEKHALSFIISDPKYSKLTIIELENLACVSKSTIVRMAQKLEFKGFTDFKIQLEKYWKEINNSYKETEYINHLRNDIENTFNTLKRIDFKYIANNILKAQTIYGYGSGWSDKNAIRELERACIAIDLNFVDLPSIVEFNSRLGSINKNDIVIISSFRNPNDELIKNIKNLVMMDINIIAVTPNKCNFLTKKASTNIPYVTTPVFKKGRYEHYNFFVTLNITMEMLFRNILTQKKEN